MDDLESRFMGLGVRDTNLMATMGPLDGSSGLLSIDGWVHSLTGEAFVELNIVDVDDQLEWTCVIAFDQAEPFRMKIPPSSTEHRCIIKMKTLRRIPDSDGETPDVRHYLATSQRSCDALKRVQIDTFTSLTPEVKYPVVKDDPRLSAEWISDARVLKAVLVIDSAKVAEIHYWRITVAEEGVDAGNGGHVLLLTQKGSSQRFEIPSSILGAGARYEITVEGLQWSNDGVDGFQVLRIVCRRSGILDAFTIEASHSCVDFNIQIERSTFSSASLLTTSNGRAAPASRKWRIRIQKIVQVADSQTSYYSYGPVMEFEDWAVAGLQRFDFPLQFHPGHWYRVTVERMEHYGGSYPATSADHSIYFRAELTLADIQELHKRAVLHAGSDSLPCRDLYRNKSQKDFEDIFEKNNGIMEMYNKDNSGDPASPINLQIKGLFFMASVDINTEKPFKTSYFGSRRICIPALYLLRRTSNLYFADYYCMNKRKLRPHYVTLVMTKPNSEADEFCRGRLLQLDVYDPINNPFFYYSDVDQLSVAACHNLRVEVLFTENINISKCNLEKVKTRGRGSSTLDGKPKYSGCNRCNLRRNDPHPLF